MTAETIQSTCVFPQKLPKFNEDIPHLSVNHGFRFRSAQSFHKEWPRFRKDHHYLIRFLLLFADHLCDRCLVFFEYLFKCLILLLECLDLFQEVSLPLVDVRGTQGRKVVND